MRPHRLTAALYFAAAASAATAQAPAGTDAPDPIDAYRTLREPAARLACYDAIKTDLRRPVLTPSRAELEPVSAPAGVLNRAPLPAAPALATQAKTGSFESHVSGLFEGWSAQTRIALANGQVWQISDGSDGVYALREAKVRVIPGSFGGYFMEIDGVSQTPRVRRVR